MIAQQALSELCSLKQDCFLFFNQTGSCRGGCSETQNPINMGHRTDYLGLETIGYSLPPPRQFSVRGSILLSPCPSHKGYVQHIVLLMHMRFRVRIRRGRLFPAGMFWGNLSAPRPLRRCGSRLGLPVDGDCKADSAPAGSFRGAALAAELHDSPSLSTLLSNSSLWTVSTALTWDSAGSVCNWSCLFISF